LKRESFFLVVERPKFFSGSQTFIIFGFQMRLTVFLVCLCVLLLKGYDYLYTGTHHCCTSAQQESQLAKLKHTNRDYSLIQDTDPDDEDEYLISDDAEDEDTDSFFARKYRLLVNSSWINSHLFTLRFLHNCLKAPLTFGSLSSYKYITQQVLRI
jgi:hypothetical protein